MRLEVRASHEENSERHEPDCDWWEWWLKTEITGQLPPANKIYLKRTDL